MAIISTPTSVATSGVQNLYLGCSISIALMVALFILILLFPNFVNCDFAQYLQCGDMFISGKLPYVDFVDTNPPLIVYISAVPALVSQILPINLSISGLLAVAILVVWSTFNLAYLTLRHMNLVSEDVTAWIVALWPAVSLWTWRSNEFGEREHLFVLFFMPFLFLRFFRTYKGQVSVLESLFLGAAAGLGTCLKPYFFLIALLPEIYFLTRSRKIGNLVHPEVMAFGLVSLCYMLHFLILPREVQENLFERWIPIIYSHYRVYDCSLFELISYRRFLFCLSVLAVFTFHLFQENQSYDGAKLTIPLALFSLGGLIVYIYQFKGWGYQASPAFSGVVLLSGVLLSQVHMPVFVQKMRDRFFSFIVFKSYYSRFVFIILVFTILATVTFSLLRLESPKNEKRQREFVELLSNYSTIKDSVVIIGTSVGDAYPALILADRSPGSRFLTMYPFAMFSSTYMKMPGTTKNFSEDSAAPEIQFLADLYNDIKTNRPELIIISNAKRPLGCVPGFNILGFLTQVGFLDQALANYQFLLTFYDFEVFKRDLY